MERLSADEARLVVLWRQGFVEPIAGASVGRVRRLGPTARVGVVASMLDHIGAVQLDTISVLARSHELVAYSRFGPIGRSSIERAYWGTGEGASATGPRAFEYWSHAACILPIDSWPMFAFRRRHYARRGVRWHDVPAKAVADVLARLTADGPLTTAHIGGAKRGGEWWDWSDAKVAIEWLLDIGTVVVTRRIGWRREYDLAERAVPQALRQGPGWVDDDGIEGPPDDECLRRLVAESGRVMGVGTTGDLSDVHRMRNDDVVRLAADAGLVEVCVEGWRQPAWASPESLDWIGSRPRATVRTTLVSPFDSLVWHRPRTERVFGMTHRLEAYTPAHKRVHGYFAMPVLHQGRLVARVDPKRSGSVLDARRVTFEDAVIRRDGSVRPSAIDGTARALTDAAAWVGSRGVTIGEVVPGSATTALATEVARRQASGD